ncbi:MAG: sterol desaturase family protein [Comamonadaceae bacterium]|nr:sterol desaturase family protein [Comamonadaceae bacterium]
MNTLDFVVMNLRGALHAIWLVWPWLLGMSLLERLIPARQTDWRTWFFNALYIPVYLTVATIVLYPIAQLITPMLPVNLLGFSFKGLESLGSVLLVVLYLVMFDFFYYWFHRAQHALPFMWRYHRFHHSDTSLSVVSATRHHWSEELIRYFFMTAPLIILVGHPEVVLPWLGVFIGVDGIFIHSNIKLRLGFLGSIIVGPQYHRIHHSLESKHIDTNFAVIFAFWDRLFGTQYKATSDEFPATGVAEVKQSNGWRLLLPWPAKFA